MHSFNNKKKILYLITQSGWGGAQRYVFDLATALHNEYEITVAAGEAKTKKTLLERLEVKGIKTHSFKHLARSINPWHDVLAIFEVGRFLQKNNFNLIHTNSSKAGVIGALAARLFSKKIKIVYTAHGWVFEEPLSIIKKYLYLLIERIAALFRHATIVLSEREKEIAIKHRLSNAKNLIVIPHGLNESAQKLLPREEARQKLNLPANAFIVGAIANLYPTKGIDILIEAAANPELKELFFAIIGDGPERTKLLEMIKARALQKNFFLIGAKDEAAMYLPAFDIFVLPSRKEGLPYALLEAMAAGLPIVATDVGAAREMFENEKSALIVPANDKHALARAIKKLAVDKSFSASLGRLAQTKIKDSFSFENMIQKTRELYEKLTAKRSS